MELEEKRGLQQLSLSRDNLAVNKSDEQWDMELEECDCEKEGPQELSPSPMT